MVSDRRRRRVLLERERYWLALPELPELSLSPRELVRAVEFRLPELYPGNAGSMLWDYRILPGQGPRRILLVLAEKSHIESIRQEYPGYSIYLPLFHALDRGAPRKGESVQFESGPFRDILSRSSEGRFEYRREPVAPGAHHPSAPEGELFSTGGYRGAFRNRGTRGGPSRILLLLLILTGAAAGILLYRGRVIAEDRRYLQELAERTRSRSREVLESGRIREEIGRIRGQLEPEGLPASIDPWEFINELAALFPPGTEIRSLASDGFRFTLDLTGPDPLGLAEKLKAHPRFEGIAVEEIRARSGGTERQQDLRKTGPRDERFRISGEYAQ